MAIDLATAIAMMAAGIAMALIWNLGLQLSSAVYEVLPGMVTGMAVYGIAQAWNHPKLFRV